jgi:hypothetical protein
LLPGGCGTVVGTVGGPRRLAQDARFLVKMKQYGVPYRITSRVTDQAVVARRADSGWAANELAEPVDVCSPCCSAGR